MERKCTSNCESGCIIIGERTKLFACTSCCNTSYCNSGKGDAGRLNYLSVSTLLVTTLQILILSSSGASIKNCVVHLVKRKFR